MTPEIGFMLVLMGLALVEMAKTVYDVPVSVFGQSTLAQSIDFQSGVEAVFADSILGLAGADNLNQDPRIQQLLQRIAAQGGYTAAICAAPKVLAHAGLLQDRRATSYPGAFPPETVPGLDYLDQAVVSDGKVITSRGPGTAMDFALELIETLAGRDKRDEVEAALLRPER